MIKIIILFFLIFTLNSCGNNAIKFDANWHHANTDLCALIPASGDILYCGDERFSEFACLHKTKIIELKIILDTVKIDDKTRGKIKRLLDQALK